MLDSFWQHCFVKIPIWYFTFQGLSLFSSFLFRLLPLPVARARCQLRGRWGHDKPPPGPWRGTRPGSSTGLGCQTPGSCCCCYCCCCCCYCCLGSRGTSLSWGSAAPECQASSSSWDWPMMSLELMGLHQQTVDTLGRKWAIVCPIVINTLSGSHDTMSQKYTLTLTWPTSKISYQCTPGKLEGGRNWLLF